MVQEAKRVTDIDNFHKVAVGGIAFPVELIEGVTHYFKLECKDHQIPLKLQFKYLTPGEMHVYVSLKCKEPSHENNDAHAAGRPLSLLVREHCSAKIGLKCVTFKKQWVYVSFESPNYCQVEVTPLFAEQVRLKEMRRGSQQGENPEEYMSKSLRTLRNSNNPEFDKKTFMIEKNK